jgi:hypothetical protein
MSFKVREQTLISYFLDNTGLNILIACPHGAFLQPGTQPGTPKRKSIEVRALVFTYPNHFMPEI